MAPKVAADAAGDRIDADFARGRGAGPAGRRAGRGARRRVEEGRLDRPLWRRSTCKIMQIRAATARRRRALHREWFKHLLYAPGFYTGYGVKTMPGVREAIEQGQYQSLPAEIARVAKALEREAAWLDAITRDLHALK